MNQIKNKELVSKYFAVDTDAPSTNRGLLYQYLIVLKKWIQNYIEGTDNQIYVEVDDDIKEVGGKLIFTQVKSYSSSFSLNSDEIIKSLYNFFILFVQNGSIENTEFNFVTNTSIGKNDKLLKAWIDDDFQSNSDLNSKIKFKLSSIIKKEINRRKNNHLSKHLDNKESINYAANELFSIVESKAIEDFINRIKWTFEDENPNESVLKTKSEIRKMLCDPKFDNKNVETLESILLSEIYFRSQYQNREERLLTNNTISNYLKQTDLELNRLIKNEFIDLFSLRIENIEKGYAELNKNVIELESKVRTIEEKNELITFNKELTLIPQLFNDKILGRNNSFIELKNIMLTNKIVLVNGEYGSGKSFFVKNFVIQNKKKIDHIIYIEPKDNLIDSILSNEILLKNLHIIFQHEMSKDEKINLVFNQINKIKGNNLFVILNYDDDFDDLQLLFSLEHWHSIITSRQRTSKIQNLKLPNLDFVYLKEIFYLHLNNDLLFDDSALEEFFEYTDFNPLFIELCSKTISNSIDLDLNKILTNMKEQSLDNFELEINIEVNWEKKPIKLFSFLKNKFEFKNLTSEEQTFIEFISLLPCQDLPINDLVDICGKDFATQNKVHFANIANSLNNKGWLERKNGLIKMHRIVKEFVVYNTRKQLNGFISSMFKINWLYHRIDENAQSAPQNSYKYLRYAESILETIKEPYRSSIYQPLILLENAWLNALRWNEKPEILLDKWIDLGNRSKIYFSKHNDANNGNNLASIYNNIGHSYAENGNLIEAENYLTSSIKLFESSNKKNQFNYFIALINLLQVYLGKGNFAKINNTLRKIISKKENQSFSTNVNFAQLFYTIGLANYKFNKHKDAEDNLNHAIKLHLETSIFEKNDYFLAKYYIFLSAIKIKLNYDCESIISPLKEAAKVIEGNKLLNYKKLLKNIYKQISEIYSINNYKIESDLYMEKYSYLHENE